jgi:hypothetical protein
MDDMPQHFPLAIRQGQRERSCEEAARKRPCRSVRRFGIVPVAVEKGEAGYQVGILSGYYIRFKLDVSRDDWGHPSDLIRFMSQLSSPARHRACSASAGMSSSSKPDKPFQEGM